MENVSDACSKLENQWQAAQSEWSNLAKNWNDQNAANFAARYWNPIENSINTYLSCLSRMAVHIEAAERELKQVE